MCLGNNEGDICVCRARADVLIIWDNLVIRGPLMLSVSFVATDSTTLAHETDSLTRMCCVVAHLGLFFSIILCVLRRECEGLE